MRIWLVLVCITSLPCSAVEYLYPVAWVQRADGIKIYLNYQKSVAGSSELLLWEWDPVTKVVGPVVLPAYTPAAVRLLPGTTDRSGGLCFVDKGRILIKSFNKRSPKAISFYEPIDDIALIEWIDQQTFYFMGKEGRNFGIFHGTTQGTLTSVVYAVGTDFLYPQTQGNDLFFVSRTNNQFAIVKTQAPHLPGKDVNTAELLSQQHRLVTEFPLIQQEALTSIINLGSQPAAFLQMRSPQEGYYVEHPVSIDRHQQHIPCKFHKISMNANNWHDEVLFTFQIPAHLLVGSSTERLYESLLPLLPRVEQRAIYFVDCQGAGARSDLFRYDMSTKQIVPLSAALVTESNFAPLRVNPMVFYGGVVTAEDLGTGNRLPSIWINEQGMLCAELPAIVDIPEGSVA